LLGAGTAPVKLITPVTLPSLPEGFHSGPAGAAVSSFPQAAPNVDAKINKNAAMTRPENITLQPPSASMIALCGSDKFQE
jgi:hypothetical protein